MRHLPASRAITSRVGTASLSIAAVGILALAGCGSSKSSTTNSTAPAAEATTSSVTTSSTQATTPASGTAAHSAVALAANPQGQLSYNTKTLTAKAGDVTIAFANMAPLDHNVTIESSAGKTLGATPTFQGGTKTLTLNLKAGVYKFYCSVPGHRQAGMEGTLTVQ